MEQWTGAGEDDQAPEDDAEASRAPWPNMVRLPGAVVKVAASALWPAHESYAAPCWIERAAAAVREAEPPSPSLLPSLAQLVHGLGRRELTAAPAAEQTSSVIALAALEGGREPECAELALGPAGVAQLVSGATGAALLARRALPLSEARRPWRQLVRPCVPRAGRGQEWPAVCERLGRLVEEPVLLDRGDMVAEVWEADGWTLVAAGADDHALSWVPSDALDEWVDEWVGAWLPPEAEDGEAGEPLRIEQSGGERGDRAVRPAAPARPARPARPVGEAPPAARKLRREASDAPLVDAILALAEAATARLSVREARGHAPPAAGLIAGAELWPTLVAELVEAWNDSGIADDERLAALTATDLILLAVAVAPALDRATARRYRGFASPGEPLTVGLVIDLAGGSAATRVRLGRRLARELPLRAGEVVLAGAGQIPVATGELSVAPWVIAACYG